jgi:hypothetical protein
MPARYADGKRPGWAGLAAIVLNTGLGIYGQHLLNLAWWQQLLITPCVLVLVTALTVVDRGQDSSSAGRFIRRFGKTLAGVVRGALGWLVWLSPGIAVGVLAFFVVKPIVMVGSCGLPTNLRVLTTPESLTAMTNAARAYEVDTADGDGCRRVTISVTANGSVADVQQGFANGWLTQGSRSSGSGSAAARSWEFMGPRPDIWIPASKSTARDVQEFVEDAGNGGQPLEGKTDLSLGDDDTVGVSPMVVAVFTQFDKTEPRAQLETNLKTVFDQVKVQQGLTAVARPLPDTSEAALLSTPALYRAQGTGQNSASDARVEKTLNPRRVVTGDPAALQAGDAATLLCHFRAADSPTTLPPSGVAVIVPENILAAYDRGDPLGTACPAEKGKPSKEWLLSPYYSADLPVLDHPFVRVRWPGESTDRQERAIEDFREWLGSERLTQQGFRTATGDVGPEHGANPLLTTLRDKTAVSPPPVSTGPLHGRSACTASVQQVLGCYKAARPQTRLNLMIDVSGSMAQPAGDSGLTRAQDMARVIVSGARTGDQIRVRSFSCIKPTSGGRGCSAEISPPPAAPITITNAPAPREALQKQVQETRVKGADLPLIEAIEKAGAELAVGSQSLVILTDGQNPDHNPQVADKAPATEARLHRMNADLRVFLVLTGASTTCDDSPVEPIEGAFGDGSCIDGMTLDGQPKAVDDLAGEVISNIVKASR